MPGTDGWRICGANRQNGKGPCGAPALKGSNRCRLHGGAAHKLANARRVAIEKMEKAAAHYGYAVQVDAADALQQEIDRTNGLVIFLGTRLRNAGAGDLVEAIGTEVKEGNLESYQIKKVEPIVGPWVQLYLRERQHLLALTRTALSVGLEERRLDENRRMDAALEVLVMTLLTSLGHDPFDEKVRKAVGQAAEQSQLMYEQSAMPLGEIVPLHHKKRGGP
jgi:hypothetical protein